MRGQVFYVIHVVECALTMICLQMHTYPATNTITVTRLQAATPPISGSFQLEFSGAPHSTRRTSECTAAAASVTSSSFCSVLCTQIFLFSNLQCFDYFLLACCRDDDIHHPVVNC